MATPSALQFAEQGKFSQVRAFAGDVLYTEGMPAPHMYAVKEGEVDLYLVRDEKRTVIETLRKGQCFGIEPHQTACTRVHNAAARTYCELYLIDNGNVNKAIDASADLVRSALTTLSERLSVAHELIATRVNYQPDLLVYAQLLHLLGMADVGRQPAPSRGHSHGSAAPVAKPPLQDLFTHARLMFGHSDRHIRGVLDKFLSLHLLRIEDERGAGKQLVYTPCDLVAKIRRIVNDELENDKLSYEYLSLDEFAALVDVDRTALLKKLSAGEFADDVFTFRRAEIMRLLDEKGRRFFAERKIKSPAEFQDVSDIEFADSKSIFAVASKLDSIDIAQVLQALGDGEARNKLLASLSRRRCDEVENDLQGLGEVDPIEARRIGQSLISGVKSAMLQQAQ